MSESLFDLDIPAATPAPAGEWLLEVFIPGKPAPQGSKHARPIFRGRGEAKVFTGKVAQVESSKSGVNEWRADVRAACVQVWGDREPLDRPLVLEIEFVRKRPVSAPKRRTPWATTMPDLSKLLRSTEDAITSAGVWADDSRVVLVLTAKRIAEIGEAPGAWIAIREALPSDIRPRTLRVASSVPPDAGPSQDDPGGPVRPPAARTAAKSGAS